MQGRSGRVACIDSQAPSTGYTCARCPAGYNAKPVNNVCVDTNGCDYRSNPCHSSVKCSDRKAPGKGAVCGKCPAGSTGNGIGKNGCTDINDCGSKPCGQVSGSSCRDTGVSRYACTCPKGYQSLGNTLRPVKALLPHSSDSSQFPGTSCSSFPLVVGRSNVAC